MVQSSISLNFVNLLKINFAFTLQNRFCITFTDPAINQIIQIWATSFSLFSEFLGGSLREEAFYLRVFHG
jgi:hypothetical protein